MHASSSPKRRTVEISPAQLQAVHGGVSALARSLGTLDAAAGAEATAGLLSIMGDVLGGEAALRRASAAEDHLGLRSLQAGALAYPKLWERAHRAFTEVVEALERGAASDIVAPLTLLSQSFELLPRLRPGWARENGLGEPLTGRAEGTGPLASGVEIAPVTAAALAAREARAEPLLLGALREMFHGDYGGAEQSLRGALRQHPAHGEARLMLGELLRRTDRTEEARVECHHLLEAEAVQVRLAASPGIRLGSQVRVARAHLCLARGALVEARPQIAIVHLRQAREQLEWALRHATSDVLQDSDRAHLQDEAHEAWVLLDRLAEALGEERPVRLRP